jgi:hypothetical protein
MMNLKGFGRNREWPNQGIIKKSVLRNLENQEKPQLG